MLLIRVRDLVPEQIRIRESEACIKANTHAAILHLSRNQGPRLLGQDVQILVPDDLAGQTQRVERSGGVSDALAVEDDAFAVEAGDEDVDFVAEFSWEGEERTVWLVGWVVRDRGGVGARCLGHTCLWSLWSLWCRVLPVLRHQNLVGEG